MSQKKEGMFMFVDEVVVRVIAGNGGDGCTAFRREKYVPDGGPFGGNGGKGSNIVFVCDEGLKTLIDLRYHKIIKGKKGENGLGKNQHGKGEDDIVIKVPLGTTVTDIDTNLVVADLIGKDDKVVVAHGGRGGRGNSAFATPSNPAPNFSEKGEPGEEKLLKIELKLLADVGLVGMPSVGKSTILSMISAAKPKIAAYHFTTLSPNLGVVKCGNDSYVVADLPGLIEGASLGEGLGEEFLRHIERTRVIVHVIDMSGFEGRDPIDDYKVINKELGDFNADLLNRKMIVIANKMDLEGAEENLKKFTNKYKDIKVFLISAIKNEGLKEVITYINDCLKEIDKKPLYKEEEFESHVLYKFKEEKDFNIYKEDNVWVINSREIEKILKMTKFNTTESEMRFAKRLNYMGVDEKLKALGANHGDNVRILDYVFTYQDYD